MRETNFTLGPIQKSLYLLLLYQFTFAQNRPKSDISGALGPIHYITLKAFAMASGYGTKWKTCFGGPRIILHAHWKKYFSKIEVWLFNTLRDPPPTVWQNTTLFPDFFLRNPSPTHTARDGGDLSSEGVLSHSPCLVMAVAPDRQIGEAPDGHLE